MSGYAGSSDDVGNESGITFLPKPFTVEQLLKAAEARPPNNAVG